MGQEYNQVLLGSLFGDGGLERNKSDSEKVGVRFKERHSLKQSKYLLWKKSILSQQLRIKSYLNSYSITIYSNVSPILKEYHNKFYPSGRGYKIFSLEMLNKLKPLGLAIWYMDDGHFNKRSYNFKISLDQPNSVIVKYWFKQYLNMVGKIYGNKETGVCIEFNAKDTRIFFRLIHKFIHPDMKYKIKRSREELIKVRSYQKNWQINNREKCRKYALKYLHKKKREKEKSDNQRC